MRLGGYSHTNGLTLFSDILKIKATRKKERDIECKIEWILPPKWLRKLGKKKYLSIFLVLYYQWKAFDFKIKLLLATTFVLLLLEELLEIPVTYNPLLEESGWYKLLFIPILLLLIPRLAALFRYHGAEHKVINCYCRYGYANTDLAKASSRFNQRCGTNIVVVFLSLYGILWIANIDSVVFIFIIFLMAVIIVKKISENNNKRWEKYLNFMQFFTVWEPRQEELEVALKAFTLLQEGHILYQKELLNSK